MASRFFSAKSFPPAQKKQMSPSIVLDSDDDDDTISISSCDFKSLSLTATQWSQDLLTMKEEKKDNATSEPDEDSIMEQIMLSVPYEEPSVPEQKNQDQQQEEDPEEALIEKLMSEVPYEEEAEETYQAPPQQEEEEKDDSDSEEEEVELQFGTDQEFYDYMHSKYIEITGFKDFVHIVFCIPSIQEDKIFTMYVNGPDVEPSKVYRNGERDIFDSDNEMRFLHQLCYGISNYDCQNKKYFRECVMTTVKKGKLDLYADFGYDEDCTTIGDPTYYSQHYPDPEVDDLSEVDTQFSYPNGVGKLCIFMPYSMFKNYNKYLFSCLSKEIVDRFYQASKGFGGRENKFHIMQNFKSIHLYLKQYPDQFRSPKARKYYGIPLKRSKSDGDKPSKQPVNKRRKTN